MLRVFGNFLLRNNRSQFNLSRIHMGMHKCSQLLFSPSVSKIVNTEFREPKHQFVGQINPKLQLSFTCKICSSKVTKHISKQAYNKGVVIAICDNCDSKHLIADNLGWFASANGMRNIEEIMASKGETVKKKVTDDVEVN